MAYCGNKVCSLYTHTYIYHILMVFFSTTPMSQLAPLYPSYQCLNASGPIHIPTTKYDTREMLHMHMHMHMHVRDVRAET